MRINEFYRNIILTILIIIVILFVGLGIIFNVNQFLPGDPIAAYLAAIGAHNPAPGLYQQIKCELGFCDPLILQYFRFIGDLFTGQWGISVSLVRNEPVIDLVGNAIVKTVGLISLPLILGIGLGIFLGEISSRNRGTWKEKIIRLYSILGISLPVFFLCMLFQYSMCYELGICEPWGISILPIVILAFAISALITWQTRYYMIKKTYNRSILSNTIIIGIIYGYIFMFYMLVEETFNIYGLGMLFINSLWSYDYFLIAPCLFVILIMFIISIVISNLIFSFHMSRKNESLKHNLESGFDDGLNKGDSNVESNPEESIKDYLQDRLKSPFFIIGTILVIFFIFVAIFPQLITQYSLSETLNSPSVQWSPPSSEHPLGQSILGLDVLALIVWGIRDLIVVSFYAILIGLIGGCILGLIAGKFNQWGYRIIMGLMIFFYIFPGIVFFILLIYINTSIFGPSDWYVSLCIGILLIPNFTRVIANATSGEININKIAKAVVNHIPLYFAIVIILYTAVGFLGVYPLYSIWELENQPIPLGTSVNLGSEILSEAPWASLWPGLTIFGIVLSFLLLHVGLQEYQTKSRVEED